MSQKTEEFKEFVKSHPEFKNIVSTEKKSWQSLFEEWSLLGATAVWDKYKDGNVKEEISVEKPNMFISKETQQIGDMLKTCVNYVKKINPDNVTKTITNIQKIMALVAGVGAANTVNAAKSNKLTGDPLFDRRFDEWY